MSVTSKNPFELLMFNGEVPQVAAPVKVEKQAEAPKKVEKTEQRRSDNGRPKRNNGPRSDAPRREGRNGEARRGPRTGAPRRDFERKPRNAEPKKDSAESGEAAAEKEPKTAEVEAEKEAPVEPEEVNFTLDEYYAKKKAIVKELPEVRQVVDDAKWKDGVALNRAEDEYFSADLKSKNKGKKDRKEKVHVSIEQRFNEAGRRGAFDNNRRPRNNRSGRTNDVNVNDTSAFPSLS